jgi:crotonobetaine/carnitine-CoA ligase
MYIDPRMPAVDRCVLRAVIDRHVVERPDKVFAVFENGESWTYADLHHRVRRAAAALQALGVRQGDYVLSWQPNGPHAILTWFGLNYLGAIYVPVNTAYRGTLLAHVIENAGASLIVLHGGLADRLAGVPPGTLRRAIVVGTPNAALGLEVIDAAVLARDTGRELVPPEEPIAPWHVQNVIYTSGTTGPSKGVLSSYLHLWSTSMAFHFVTEDDRGMANLPLFHAGGTGAVYRMLVKGASVAVVDSFRTQTFWQDIRSTGTTILTLLGAMTPFLMKEPPSPRDRDHTLRAVSMVPLSEDSHQFAERFGVDIYTTFNMTEVSCPLFSQRNPVKPGSCGEQRPGVEARVVDENDCEVPPGTTGELIVRTAMPWAMNSGYHRNPEATAKAWRNGWFHTGDVFRMDAEGTFYFVDRLKDAIRRRGENISSFEVEREITAHPAVREAAVVAAQSEFAEDEVMAIVALVPGCTLDATTLIEFLQPRLPHFMLPRYIRFLDELPKTPTQKVQKHLLRADGRTPDTWDSTAAGLRFKRERLA